MPLSALFACCVLLQGQAPKLPKEQAEHYALMHVAEWPDFVARDRRATFGLRTEPDAARELARPEASERAKCAAVFALGAAQAFSERARIQALAQGPKGELRNAALWALGALGSATDLPELLAGLERGAAVAEASAMALALHGSREARARLERLAGDAEHEVRQLAADALGAVAPEPRDSELARRLLDLRFEAARRFGLIDGEAWDVVLINDLARHQRFVGRLVYRCAAELRRPGIRDHFLEVALAGAPPERMRGVVAAIPSELARMIDNDLYTPADPAEWRALVDEIDRRRLESLTEPILRRALGQSELRLECAALLARVGATGASDLLDASLRSLDAEERRTAARALGERGGERYLPSLAAMESDLDAHVRAAALVARCRHSDQPAVERLRQHLALDVERAKAEDAHPEALLLVEELLECAADASVRKHVLDLLPRLPERWKGAFAAELCFGGHEPAKAMLRDSLRAERPSGERGARAVAALGIDARAADLTLARELFPLGDDFDVDLELASLLLRAKDGEVLPILRGALWSEPWNRSVLAGALWIEMAGTAGLRLELQRPPTGVSSRDLRRVGFALGEWGGESEVRRLSERVGGADPALQGAVLGALGARTH
jgi:HEAT repeat protein